MATTAQSVADVCAEARDAARELARLDSATKDAALHAMADALEQRSAEILYGNARDMEAGQDAGLHAGLLDRLKLDDGRLANIARDVRAIAALPDPVGETIDGHRLDNGLDVRRVRVPLGVVAVGYEARPNVTVDASALLPEVRQRDRAARLLDGGSLELGARAGVRLGRALRGRARGRHLDRDRWRPRRAAPDRHPGRRGGPDHPPPAARG